MAEKMVVDALEVCAAEKQDGAVQWVATMATRSIISAVLDKGLVAGKGHEAATRAVVHPVMIQAATDVLLKEYQLIDLIAKFVLS